MTDLEWFAPPYQSCYPRVVLATYAVTNDLHEAEAVVQEAAVHARLPQARAISGDLESWIRTVALDLAARHRRRRAPLALIPHRHQPSTDAEPAVEPAGLHQAVRALGHQQRAIIVLHHLADLPVGDIAPLLGIPVETVRAQLSTAQAELAEARRHPAMPDLNVELTRLREALMESLQAPDHQLMVDRTRQQLARKTMRTVAVAAVLVVGVAVPLLRTQLSPVADQSGTFAHRAVPSVPRYMARFVYAVDFADELHGYALRGDCVNALPDVPCRNELLVTEDGLNWQGRALPNALSRNLSHARLLVFGPGRLAIAESQPGRDRWYSNDAGHTWQKAPHAQAPPMPAIPPDGALDFVCAGDDYPGKNCTLTSLAVTLPDSGRLARLTHSPALHRMRPDASPASDGNWWVSGTVPSTGRWAVAVSRDAGRSWSVHELPERAGQAVSSVQISVGPRAVYALAMGPLPNVDNGLVAVFRSTDGASWEQTWQASVDREPRSVVGVAVAASDGSLLVHTELSEPYVSTDGGVTFVAGPATTSHMEWTRAGYLYRPIAGPFNAYRLSRDGVHWTDLTIG
jgi:RNA polymerase sigma factor (sigma-70 family)